MKQFDWNEFKSDKVAVHCKTEKEAKDFIKIAYDNWVEWNVSDRDITNFCYYRNETCYAYYGSIEYSSIEFYYNNDYKIIEWSDYMNTNNEQDFTKDMLKDGMVVECVNGGRYLKLNNNFINNGYMPLDRYNEDLTLKGSDDYDYTVNKIYKSIDVPYISELFNDEYLELIWKRKEEKPLELTMEDIESQYGCKVKIVNK